jgi:hypothetical protein
MTHHSDPGATYPQSLILSQFPDEYAPRAMRTAAWLAHRSGASSGELRDVLEALGLIEPEMT